MSESGDEKSPPSATTNGHSCSFCHKQASEVRRLINAGQAAICNECAELCREILEGERHKDAVPFRPQSEAELCALGLKPPFKIVPFRVHPRYCLFLNRPQAPFDAVYRDDVCSAAHDAYFTVERTIDSLDSTSSVEDIWDAIRSRAIVLADLTGRDPQVMYQIGMAHTLGKAVVIITQTIDDVPFDLRHYRCILYENTPDVRRALRTKLRLTLQCLRRGGLPGQQEEE
jgi:hypothetical protein